MVFLIQRTQNRDALAIHLKLTRLSPPWRDPVLDKLQDESQLKRDPVDFRYAEGRIELEVILPANSVASIEFEFPPNF
jgi:hypothetical protein